MQRKALKMTHLMEERGLAVKMETHQERRKRVDRSLKVMKTVISSEK